MNERQREYAAIVPISNGRDSVALAELRRDLAQARSHLRACEESLRTERALAEQRAINTPESGYAALRNEGERARFLTCALDTDDEFQEALLSEAEAREEVEVIEVEIAIHEDARRERQMAQRDREMELQLGDQELRWATLNHSIEQARLTQDTEGEVERLVREALGQGEECEQ